MNCIYTAKYLVSGTAPPVTNGALLICDGRIAATGNLKDIKRDFPGVEVVSFVDAILLPLFINAHTHLELTDFPQWAKTAEENESPDNFVDWLLRLIRVKQKLHKEHYSLSLAHGISQSVAAGTGAVGDILAHHEIRNLYQKSSLVGTLFLETLGQDPAVIGSLRKKLTTALLDVAVGSVQLGISPHSAYTSSSSYLQKIYSYSRRNRLRCATHMAESKAEIEFIEQSRGTLVSKFYRHIGWGDYVPKPSGQRPVEYLQQRGGLFPENLLVHGVHLNDVEIEILAKKKMRLVLCPRSNATLNVGIAPAGKLYRAGVKLSLGTDSMASCGSLSIWDEMAFAHHQFAGELDAPTLFNMATSAGADALGLSKELGSLEVGMSAGFQVLLPQTTVTVTEIFDYFISSYCNDDIIQVYHRGKPQLIDTT